MTSISVRGASAMMVAAGAVALGVVVAFVPGTSARATGDPGDLPLPGSESASETLEELERLGYSVSTNWVNGSRTVPLNRCRVVGYHSPGITEETNVVGMAIVMDVLCPDDD
jgi:hypothetical protein